MKPLFTLFALSFALALAASAPVPASPLTSSGAAPVLSHTRKTPHIFIGQPLTVLHSFNTTDGGNPYGNLVQGVDGNFYGTSVSGGANGDGTIYRITSGGALTVLHSFSGTDGNQPVNALVQGADGNFYGTTFSGGANDGGAVFQITPGGTLTTLHSFIGPEGSSPYAP